MSNSTLQVPLDDLIIQVQSSNPGRIPLRNSQGKPWLSIVQSDKVRSLFTLLATPAPDRAGTAKITVTAYNGEFSRARAFQIRIRKPRAAAAVQQADVCQGSAFRK